MADVTAAHSAPAEPSGEALPEREARPVEGTRSGRVTVALFIGWRNLTGERRRWVMSTVALAIAAMLVIFLEGTSRWITTSSTAYLDHSSAQLVVSEKGVDDLLFAQSAFPQTALDQVGHIPGVSAVAPVVGVNSVVPIGGTHLPVFLVGFRPGQEGGPWAISQGSGEPHGDEVVVDRGFASIAGVHVGDSIQLFGRTVRVVGLSAQTNDAGDFFLFVPLEFAQQIAGAGVVSYGLVQVSPSASVDAVATQARSIAGVQALPTATMAANDREMIATSFAQPIQIVVLVGLVAGVLIAGIVLYTATVEHSRDYAVLKALGGGGGVLYGSALLQSLALSLMGIALGTGLAAVLAAAFDRWHPVIATQLDAGLVATVAAVILGANVLATLLPIRHVRHIDPQEVFKA